MNKKHGILLLTDIFGGFGGSERNISQLLAGIDKDRFELYVACLTSIKLPENVRDPSAPIIDLHGDGIYTLGGLKNLALLRRLVREKKISLILTYHESSDFYGLALSHLCRIPVICSRRDMGFKTRRRHRLAFRLVGR